MVSKVRRLLIHIGKSLPFLLCFIVLISYAENVFALATNDFLYYDGYYIVNTPVSFAIGLKFEYDLLMVVVAMILSIAIETCKWNKFALCYLATNLFQKSYLANIELDALVIYIICIANILVCDLFIYKGIKIIRIL
jgi:hypothetical protein